MVTEFEISKVNTHLSPRKNEVSWLVGGELNITGRKRGFSPCSQLTLVAVAQPGLMKRD
jgi:hypothetical protein